jgi:hypothetical protein
MPYSNQKPISTINPFIMKKTVLFALLGMGLVACSADETTPETTTAKAVETPSISKTKPEASAIMVRYGKNKTILGYKKASEIYTSECKDYLDANGHVTTGLNDAQIINLFLKNF